MARILEELRSRDDLVTEATAQLSSGDETARAMALVALRVAASPSALRAAEGAIEAVRNAVRDDSPRVRVPAVACLAAAGAGWSEELVEALDDPVTEVRSAAARALLESDRSKAATLLSTRLSAADEGDRVAILALGLQNSVVELAPIAERLLSDPSARVRTAAAELLGLAIDQPAGSAVVALTRALSDADERVRRAAVLSMTFRAEHVPASAFVPALEDSSPVVRAQAAGALGRTGDQAACAALVPLVDDPVRTVRHAAVSSLTRLECSLATPRLLDRAMAGGADVDEIELAALVDALGALGGVTAKLVETASRHSAARVRAAAMAGWSKLRPPGIAVLCEALTADPDASVRAAACAALSELDAPRADEALLATLLGGDSAARVRQAAAAALSRRRDPDILRAQAPALGDPAPEVRARVARNLRHRADSQMREVLARRARDETDLAVRAELYAAQRGAADSTEAGATPAPFDPAGVGDAYATWLVDANYYPASERIVFYNFGTLEAVDLDDRGAVYTYEVDGATLRIAAAGAAPIEVEFSIAPAVYERFPNPVSHGYRLTLAYDPFFATRAPLSLFCVRAG